ncbi:hypothetical protein EF888_01385 [Silicimonas algicola]|uniref:DUF5681 domain-containing protein n=1 Tax=Silicimonas algicola TaxID=1826607 RepID=A0A316G1B3_9RHOB|nr:DUF5681 domain-containing protein [Silicimonas algicola]AZQ65904.1 hypothetical protein EF888_01385 [Silicimonas algicola]PWK54711.1 hypothetical protein C8D95_1102 [Silicimonas algicola]
MSDGYDVGYRRPPEHGRFKKGQSGNPAGRRTEQERFATVLREELANEIVMKVGDKKLKASVMRGLTKLLINMALAGDKKAIAELMRQINRYFPETHAAEDASLPPTEEDLQILENFVRRRLGRTGSGVED